MYKVISRQTENTKMQRKSKHKEISDLDKSSECPVVKRGYLDTEKQSNNTEMQDEINNLTEPFKCPVVERGYFDTIDQSENTETQEEKKVSLFRKILWSCVFVFFILGIVVGAIVNPKDFGFHILLPLLVILFLVYLLF